MMKLNVSTRGAEVMQRDLPGCVCSCSVTYDGEKLERLDSVSRGRMVVTRFSEKVVVTDWWQERANILVLRRQWRLAKPGSYRLHNYFSYDDGGKANQVIVPAVWYQDNEHGVGRYPSVRYGDYWAFKENRMPIPGCIQLFNGETVFCCAVSPAEDTVHVCSSSWDSHGIRMTIPGYEWPYSYHGKTALLDTSKEVPPCLEISEPVVYERTFWIQLEHGKNRLSCYRRFVESVRELSPRPKLVGGGWCAYRDAKVTRILNLIQKSPEGEAYLKMGEGNGEVQPVYEFTSASFLVKSLEAATCLSLQPADSGMPFARSRLCELFGLPDDDSLLPGVAEKIGRFFLRAESAPGIFRDCYDLECGYFGGYLGIGEHQEFKDLVNSRCNGEAMKQYVLLYKALKQRGRDVPEFLEIAKRVAGFYCGNQLSTGSFGRWWTLSGMPVNTVGTNGAYIGSFLIELLTVLDDDDLRGDVLSAVRKAYSFYGEMAEEGLFYGDTLDADSCDKEAGLALLAFFLDLYEQAPDPRYLESALRAAHFVLLWIWQTDQTFPAGSPLAQERFSTTGMTSVSVAHHHMDFYGMAIAYDFLRLHEATGDVFFRDQAVLMMNACRQLVGTVDNLLGRPIEFLGWQPEQINYTDWDYFDRPSNFCGTYDIDIAWVNVLGLGAYLKIRNRFPAVLEG
ncbi:MAG: hypothetical protein SPD11_01315 [Sphaerochaetaceae bacterium]|nr:hypothetical protein [Sphaerochaetaceae bacterium]